MFVYYVLLPLLSLAIVLIIRFFIRKRRNQPVELYLEALRVENSGNYLSALIMYESALGEAKKNKYNDNVLEEKIREKLRVLQTMIDYENSFIQKNKPVATA
jgi:hypothetical protein